MGVMELTHKDELIRYDEEENKWRWDGTGYSSLKAAKEAINKSQRQSFKDLTGIKEFGRYSSPGDARWRWVTVQVTSLAGRGEVWVSYQGKHRSKESIRAIHADTPENRTVVEQIKVLESEIQERRGHISRLTKYLQPLVLPGEEVTS